MTCDKCKLEILVDEPLAVDPKSGLVWHIHCADVKPAFKVGSRSK